MNTTTRDRCGETTPRVRMPPSVVGHALNYFEVFQRNLGPLATRRALKNLWKLSARRSQGRGSKSSGFSVFIAGLVVGLITVLGGAALAADRADDPRPNILLIVSDDQGYHDLGCFGNDEIKTPHLDRLAAGGVRLTSFYVSWPACTPSRGSLLTGRYPQRNGLYDMIRNDRVDDGHLYSPEEYAVSPERVLGMDVREVMISDVLRAAGYVNGCYGKWDGGQLKRYLPLQRGFDEFYGFCNTGIDYFTHERYGVPSMFRDNEPTTEDKRTDCTYLFQLEAAKFIKQHHDRPFFLYVPFNAPHGASNLDRDIRGTVQAPRKYLDMYPAGTTKREEHRRSYMAAVTCMDDAIGELLDLLDEYKIADNTLVIFLSDNGGSGIADNTTLRGKKSTMWAGDLRVPCLVRWPNRLPAGKTSDQFLTSLEIFPTILAATGAKHNEEIVLDGFDMLPILKDVRASPRKEMFWQRRSLRAARVGDWKWVDVAGQQSLFDLSEDVSEQHNLAKQRPDMLKQMQAHFARWRSQMDAAEPRGPFRDY